MKKVTGILTALLAVLLVGISAFSAEATEETPVAQVLRSGQLVESYATVQEAFDAAADAEDLSVKLLQDVRESATVTGTVYLDLAGADLRGIIIEGTLYCMDTSTDQYRGGGAGRLTVESGEPALHVKTSVKQTGSIKRYLRVKDEEGYSFHRFYMGVTHMVLDPENNGMGYRATFAGDTWVKGVLSQEDTYGVVVGLSPLEETLEGQEYRNGNIEGFYAGSAFTRTLTVANILSEDAIDNPQRGKTRVYARAYIRLKDGTLLFSSQVENDLQTLLETVNDQWDRYNPVQKEKAASMLATFNKQMSHLDVENIHHHGWTPWTGTWEDGGRYYLTEDVSLDKIIEIPENATVDICLNGHDILGDAELFRIFRVKGTLNLHDHQNSDGSFSGDVVSQYTRYSMGTVFYVHERGEFNLCGGNLKYAGGAYASRGGVGMLGNANENNDYAYMNMFAGTISGGRVQARWDAEANTFLEQGGGYGGNVELCAYSIFNMYGGTISDGEVYAGMKDETTAISVNNGNGGNLSIGAEGIFNMYGGTITGGTAYGKDTAVSGKGGNIFNLGTVNLYGGTVSEGTADVNGGNIYIHPNSVANMYGGTVKDAKPGDALYGGNFFVGGSLTVEGGTIANGVASKAGGNIYISSSGKVTIKDGQIYGGGGYDNTAGGNIRINGGDLEISGGKLWGGISDYDGYLSEEQSSASRGGSVQITSGTFQMTGGSIGIDAEGNLAGGLAANGGNLNMTDGTIVISGGIIAGGEASQGGNLNIQTGIVTLSGGDIYGGIGKHYGGNLYVEGAAEILLSGADIYNGSAYYNEAGANIYVNGGTVTLASGRIWGGVADSEGNSGNDDAVSGANVLVNNGTFNMTGGSIGIDEEGNLVGGTTGKGLAVGRGANLYIMDTGAVNFTGGAIAGGNAVQGGGIYLKGGSLTLSQMPIFSGNKGGDIYLASGNTITLGGGGLTVSAPITVLAEDSVFATNVQSNLSNRFASGTEYLSVGYDTQAKTLYLYDPETHTHCACAGVSVNTLAKHTCTDLTWKPFPKAALEAATEGYTLREGNYYLKENVTYTGTGNITVAAGTTVRICLNGHKLESSGRFFVRGDLEITDCSYDSADGSFDGSMVANAAGKDGAIATSFNGARISIYGGNFTSNVVAGVGGLFYVSNQNGSDPITAETVMNIYNGKFYGGSAKRGGNICVSMASGSEIPSVLNMYGGEISGGLVTDGTNYGYGGNVYCAGTMNMYGGTVKTPQVGTAVTGGNFYVSGTLTVNNTAVVANGVVSKAGGNIYINGGTVYIKGGQIYGGGGYDNTAGGNIRLNTGTLEISGGKIWGGISDFDGYTAGSQNGNSRGGCIQMTTGTFVMTGGSIGIDDSGKAAGGQAAYGGNLNVQGGNVTISGGTIANGTANRGGNINIQGGTITLSGGDVYGGLSKAYGGNLFVEGAEQVTVSGADIYNGSAYYNEAGANIYVNGGTVTLASGRIWGGVADSEGNSGNDDAVSGANVLVNNGTFNMTGGSIGIDDKGNIAAGSTGKGLPVGRGANLYVMNTGVANIRGGTISGGTAMRGGNICAVSTLNLYGGTITGGTAVGGSSASGTKINAEGGNICNFGELNVYGGTIKNGTATGGFGGNIYGRNASTNKLHLEGATITGGKATAVMENGAAVKGTGLGGGVYTGLAGVELAGNLQITGNTDSDLYLAEEATVVSTGLLPTARIGITEEYAVCLAEDASLVNCFISRMDGHTAGVVNGNVFMVKTGLDTAAVAKTVSSFSVGYAMTDINPREEGIQMSAWGNPNGRYTSGQGYNLYATTIAITDQNNTTVLMITADLQGFDSTFTDRVFTRINKATGVPKENIYLSCTHTHNAPDVKKAPEQNKRYALFLFDQLIHSAMDAMADRAPATMKTGSFDTVGMNFTRHYYYLDSKGQKVYFGDQFGHAPSSGTKVYRVLEGDPTMHMVAFDRTGKKDVLMTNWRAHPHRSGGMEAYEVDADVIGAWREYMHKNTDYLFAFYQGAAGNTNTVSRISGETFAAGKIKEYGDEMGRQLIKNGLPKLKATNTGLIQVKKITYAAAVDHSEDDRVDDAQAVNDYYYGYPDLMDTYAEQIAKAAEYGLTSVFHAQRILYKAKQAETANLDLNIFSIGDSIGFYTSPAELWSSFSEVMEKESPFPMTFYIGYCNGRVGYIPYQVTYSSYEYHFCMYTQPTTIDEMKQMYLDELKKQYNAAK